MKVLQIYSSDWMDGGAVLRELRRLPQGTKLITLREPIMLSDLMTALRELPERIFIFDESKEPKVISIIQQLGYTAAISHYRR